MASPITPTVAISTALRHRGPPGSLLQRGIYFQDVAISGDPQDPHFPLAGPHGQAAAPLSICQIPWDRLPLDESDLRL